MVYNDLRVPTSSEISKSLNKTLGFNLDYGQTETKERIPLRKTEKDNKFFIIQKGKCALCGINMIEKGIIPPDFHHKDGNPTHNDPKNIIAICPNCHRIETRKHWLAKGRRIDKERKKKNNQNQTNMFGINPKTYDIDNANGLI